MGPDLPRHLPAAGELPDRPAAAGGHRGRERSPGSSNSTFPAEMAVQNAMSTAEGPPGERSFLLMGGGMCERVGDEAPDRVEDYAPPVTIKMVDEGSTLDAYERRLLAKEGCASITQATLSTTQRLTDENWWQEVRHVVFSASVEYDPRAEKFSLIFLPIPTE